MATFTQRGGSDVPDDKGKGWAGALTAKLQKGEVEASLSFVVLCRCNARGHCASEQEHDDCRQARRRGNPAACHGQPAQDIGILVLVRDSLNNALLHMVFFFVFLLWRTTPMVSTLQLTLVF